MLGKTEKYILREGGGEQKEKEKGDRQDDRNSVEIAFRQIFAKWKPNEFHHFDQMTSSLNSDLISHKDRLFGFRSNFLTPFQHSKHI
jgi:hypothetical protein